MRFFVLLLIFISISCNKSFVQKSEQVAVNKEQKEDEGINEIISEYKPMVDSLNQVIGVLAVDLKRDKYSSESLIGNFVADLVQEYALNFSEKMGTPKPHMTLLNKGGLRTSIAKGEVSRVDIYELMPFENKIVLVEMDASSMQELADYLIEKNGQPISNAQLHSLSGKLKTFRVDGEEIKDQTYYVATSDYLANGGDDMTFFKGKKRIELELLRDVIINHIESKNMTPINVSLDGRLKVE